MEKASGWSLIEPDSEAPATASPPPADVRGRISARTLAAALVAAVAAVVAVAIWLTLPSGGVTLDGGDGPFQPLGFAPVGSAITPPSSAAAAAAASVQVLIVDIEGAVVSPGVHALPDGSRISDAIAAAGGYSPSVDIAAASAGLNLAARLSDGQQIHVPVLGEAVVILASPGDTNGAQPSSSGSALIDINHATADQLDTLPGIGPVTAQKIIDARTVAPFATVDDLESRGVVGPSTFEKLRDLITVIP